MGYHTVTDGPWPYGVTVSAYPTAELDTDGEPFGPPVATGVASANGTVEFAGLTEGESYTAFGSSGSQEFLAIGTQFRLRILESFGPSDELELVHDAVDILTKDLPGRDSRTYPYGLRRSAEWRWPIAAEEIVTSDLSRQSYAGMVLTPDDSTGGSGPERFNATSAGMVLEFLGITAQFEQRAMRSRLLYEIDRFADVISQYQWPDDPTTARAGGFMQAPSDTSALTFGTANAGLGMLEAWRATQDPRWLDSARRAGDFLMVMADPNPTYTTLHGVSPINRVAGGYTWAGFLDGINNADKITTVASTINARCCELLYQLDPIFPTAGYWTTGQAALTFMMQAAAQGYDSFEPSGNADATWVTVGSDNDAAFHYALSLNTRGTDGIEYLLSAALRCGWDRTALRTLLTYWMGRPHNDPESDFGAVYDALNGGEICLTGYMDDDGAKGSYWDTQGAGTLLEAKYELAPVAYRRSLEAIIASGIRIGTILDENFKIVVSDPGFDDYRYATSGVIVRVQCAGGLARVLRKRAQQAEG